MLDHEKDTLPSVTPFDIDRLPDSFQRFLSMNGIDPTVYTISNLPRYVRWNTQYDGTLPTLHDLRSQLDTDHVWAVPGREGVFGFMDNKRRLFDVPAYQARALFGMDLSSIIAVEALDVHPNDHIMDLCCAPGAKLCMLANLVAPGKGTVTGVDIATHRLATCRALLRKYNVGFNVRLFAADGTTFGAHPPARVGGDLVAPLHKEPSIMPYWAPKVLRHAQQATTLYDKVLVDAECTHDGSIAHILKYEQWGWDAFEKNFMDPDRIDTIAELQRNLLAQGWRMLKPGGVAVYSTCSLTIQQNEDIIGWFLQSHMDATLEPVPGMDLPPVALAPIKPSTCATQEIQVLLNNHCLRFDPLVSRTSGFFVARLRKKKVCD
ncbi:S-adenosyl-L-methionine-dependent methyltransferase [Syncephalastrum racemosum]|uniref:S-adenosyl-L-methionine-dependent methyltransferase n=1 Tax=Syncephalastrum racemosum TaxID=13706 RepID=A0A1X2HTD1_SYNRA|nr:S-adenosyl-L-methionine-dependent methyltransferase [Syncephalastrum racemosum]